ncbi:hypothetical protein [Streptomyces sp. SID13031]|uniref:hypothetical protein n=1 Tax=Streptomyces sp. SID13031 TaxID=2706046 RepID=UPI0013CDC5EE|nr:hypothetical protein [Streptomyces sp. SID13031]NEA36605.1 hypothetical protein [Streptomyces sp. SID13031]
MPVTVIVTAVLLSVLGLTFCLIPLVAYRHGDAAERAAEHEVARQGFPSEVLAQHRVQFKESGLETLFPFGIAAVLFIVAGLDLAGVGPARVASWVVAGILLVVGGFITAGQLFATRYIEAAFKRSKDPAVRNIDARAIIEVAGKVFPSWLRPVQIVRFVLTTVGSAVVIVLLMTTAASVHFR